MEEKKKSSLSKSEKTDTPKKAEKLDENKKKSDTKPKRRANKITPARIKKEIDFLKPMFDGIDDGDKKNLVNSLIEEAAFLKVACFQAKEELKKEGLTTETVNASQKFVNRLAALRNGQ